METKTELTAAFVCAIMFTIAILITSCITN